MSPFAVGSLRPREDGIPSGWVVEDGIARPWWHSTTGEIVKWSIFLGFVAIVGGYLIIGYFHARRRLKKGLLPLRYHRFLVTRSQLARVDPSYAYPPPPTYANYPPPQYYGMQPMAPPPPVYEPPPGSTKVDPSQWRTEPTRRPAETTGDYVAPPGPPPAPVTTNNTGASNNPYRL